MKITVYVQDIECDSCMRVVEKSLKSMHGIHGYTLQKDSVIVDFDHSKLDEDKILDAISSRGYLASTSPISKMSFSKRINDFLKNPDKYAIERQMFFMSILSLFALVFLEALMYMVFFRNNPGFIVKSWQWLLYLDISIVSIAAAVWHLKAYKGTMTSMTGMMVGMTLGMQSGFMLGAVFGASNGMFIGSVVGLLAGAILGVIGGKGAGIMGSLQGLMSGLMGGTMGAMLTVMLAADHVLLFMPLFMAVNVIIMWGMTYLVYEELVEDKKVKTAPADFGTFFAYVFVFTAIAVIIMIYGPKSALVAFN